MAYSDFTLKRVKTEFDLMTIEDQDIFAQTDSLQISPYLKETLDRNVPLALAINTEKARSELIIINILLEIKTNNLISIFSGIEFTVDKEKDLNGFCDFILSRSSEQLYLDAPILRIVEAKNENIVGSIGQCIAEMYAAKLFNEREKNAITTLYGAVTTGDEWKFLKLQQQVYIDVKKYYISDIEKILGILSSLFVKE